MILLFRKDSSHGYVLKGIESLTISRNREQAVNFRALGAIPQSRTHERMNITYEIISLSCANELSSSHARMFRFQAELSLGVVTCLFNGAIH